MFSSSTISTNSLKQVQNIFSSQQIDLWELACALAKNASAQLNANSDLFTAIQAFPTYNGSGFGNTVRQSRNTLLTQRASREFIIRIMFALDSNFWVAKKLAPERLLLNQPWVKGLALEDLRLSECPIQIN